MREVLDFEWSKLNLRGGFAGTIVLAILIFFIGLLGTATLAAALSAVFVIALGGSGKRVPDRYSWLLVLGGALATLAVSLSAAQPWSAAISTGVVTLLAMLPALGGARGIKMGFFLVLWSVIALTAGTSPDIALSMSLTYLAGGLLGLLAVWLISRLKDVKSQELAQPEATNRAEATNPAEMADRAERGSADTSPDTSASGPAHEAGASGTSSLTILRFIVIYAFAVGLAVWTGYLWFPDHAAWVALTLVLVARPPARQVFVLAVGRALGTALGVLASVLLVQGAQPSEPVLVVAFVLSAFLMLSTSKVNSALSTVFTTMLLLMAAGLVESDVEATGFQRLGATVVGVVLALLLVGLLGAVTRGQNGVHPPERQAGPSPVS